MKNECNSKQVFVGKRQSYVKNASSEVAIIFAWSLQTIYKKQRIQEYTENTIYLLKRTGQSMF